METQVIYALCLFGAAVYAIFWLIDFCVLCREAYEFLETSGISPALLIILIFPDVVRALFLPVTLDPWYWRIRLKRYPPKLQPYSEIRPLDVTKYN